MHPPSIATKKKTPIVLLSPSRARELDPHLLYLQTTPQRAEEKKNSRVTPQPLRRLIYVSTSSRIIRALSFARPVEMAPYLMAAPHPLDER